MRMLHNDLTFKISSPFSAYTVVRVIPQAMTGLTGNAGQENDCPAFSAPRAMTCTDVQVTNEPSLTL